MGEQFGVGRRVNPARIFSIPRDVKHLDTVQLEALAASFRRWAVDSPRRDVRVSRRRLCLVFLVLRHTGAKLGEVLALDELRDFDAATGVCRLGRERREVSLPGDVAGELREAVESEDFAPWRGRLLSLDPGHVRRKFYERAQELGLPKEFGNPSVLRRSRAIELLRQDVPLTVVQAILGQASADLTAALMDFSDVDVRRIQRMTVEKEADRRTSARNAFYGKVVDVTRGGIQSMVTLRTLGGHDVSSVVTNDSVEALGIRPGVLLAAEIKAPWVVVVPGAQRPAVASGNVFSGVVERVGLGDVSAEVVVRLEDGTEICAIVTVDSLRVGAFAPGMPAWVVCSAFSVILRAD
ncbi:molybdate transport system regulatory protein [Desulfobaculum xiamenense]|uniref:Molybdate transport system regulatory protein n=1 Tax=Desulfobaculum xiamenense TaxID=995050 RepID=A0A846QUB1_9BACT|nr:TOBE domain-containing protein [Desulfobaculum xiamenense]NJB68229.1 molybdate transport system regulatory protein [Desulfobaculum xiamenense]